jgi:hypothetical protein
VSSAPAKPRFSIDATGYIPRRSVLGLLPSAFPGLAVSSSMETSMVTAPSSSAGFLAIRPMAMVNEKSSSDLAASSATATLLVVATGIAAGSANGSFDCVAFGETFLRRTRYASTRLANSPRHSDSSSGEGESEILSAESRIVSGSRSPPFIAKFASPSRLPKIGAALLTEATSFFRDEPQKRQADMPEGNIAPHCKQVLVTGCFCAADASTPARRERAQNNMGQIAVELKNRACGQLMNTAVMIDFMDELTSSSALQACRGCSQCAGPARLPENKRTWSAPFPSMHAEKV